MMREIKDGGPAFPVVTTEQRGGFSNGYGHTFSVGGMTLRDYFAAQALIGMFASEPWLHGLDGTLGKGQLKSGVAQHAYLMADEMMKARDAK